MWLQLTVKKTCCERKHCAFCAPCCETVTLSYFGCKSSTLRVFHFGSCTGSCWLCVTFFARISTRGNRFVFFPPSPVIWRCWGKKKNLFWLLHGLPTPHLSDLIFYHSSPFPPTPATLASWLLLEHTRYCSAFGPLHLLCPFLAHTLCHIGTRHIDTKLV